MLLGLCPYTYPATSFYAALLAGSLLSLHPSVFRDARNRRGLLAAAGITFVIAAPGLLIALADPHTFGRGVHISTFVNGVNEASLATFVKNYASHFDGRYLFASGSPDPRYLCGFGILHWWYAPLIALGAAYSGRCVSSRALCCWLWIGLRHIRSAAR